MPGDAERTPHDEPDVADAGFLFNDAPEAPPPPARAEGAAAAAGAGAGYEMQEPDEPEPPPPARPTPVAPPPRNRARPAAAPRMALEPSEAVEQVWSRWAEWGASLAVLTAAAAFLVVLLYVAVAAEAYTLSVFLLVAGGICLALLSYPVLITLERPVRVTPEQAVRDFYGALSHHVPHYRRMWLLLSRAGRTSGSFASFEGFQKYWRERLARLRGAKIPKTLPLKFQVTGFKSAKSSGLSAITVSYVLEVYARGRTGDGPLASFPVETSLVKGPDRMWYLDLGTLPEP